MGAEELPEASECMTRSRSQKTTVCRNEESQYAPSREYIGSQVATEAKSTGESIFEVRWAMLVQSWCKGSSDDLEL